METLKPIDTTETNSLVFRSTAPRLRPNGDINREGRLSTVALSSPSTLYPERDCEFETIDDVSASHELTPTC